MEIPDPGEPFIAEIDSRSGNGNGIIELEGSKHLNIGPVKKDAVGTEVELEMLGGVFARCLDEDVKGRGYEQRLEEMAWQHIRERQKEDTAIESYSIEPLMDKLFSHRNVENVEFCDQCGTVMHVREEKWECGSCGYSKEIHPNIEGRADLSRKSFQEGDSSKADLSSQPDISELRKRAKTSAVEEVPEEVSTTNKTQPYNRSKAVKEYVKARASGNCEGCETPAPFTSKTGEPYLHAHHVHELSDGGSDTPDTVIALCPNCHYRVHHGEDGEEYNQQLLEKVQNLEKG